MVDQVARITWERERLDQPELESWDEVLASVGKKKGRERWAEHMRWLGWHLSAEPDAFDEYGDDAALVRKVLTVIHAVQRPPSERGD